MSEQDTSIGEAGSMAQLIVARRFGLSSRGAEQSLATGALAH